LDKVLSREVWHQKLTVFSWPKGGTTLQKFLLKLIGKRRFFKTDWHSFKVLGQTGIRWAKGLFTSWRFKVKPFFSSFWETPEENSEGFLPHN